MDTYLDSHANMREVDADQFCCDVNSHDFSESSTS